MSAAVSQPLAVDLAQPIAWMEGEERVVARTIAHGERAPGIHRLILRDTADRYWAADMAADSGRVSIVAGPMTVRMALDLAVPVALAVDHKPIATTMLTMAVVLIGASTAPAEGGTDADHR